VPSAGLKIFVSLRKAGVAHSACCLSRCIERRLLMKFCLPRCRSLPQVSFRPSATSNCRWLSSGGLAWNRSVRMSAITSDRSRRNDRNHPSTVSVGDTTIPGETSGKRGTGAYAEPFRHSQAHPYNRLPSPISSHRANRSVTGPTAAASFSSPDEAEAAAGHADGKQGGAGRFGNNVDRDRRSCITARERRGIRAGSQPNGRE
jgi:hypothetical protein